MTKHAGDAEFSLLIVDDDPSALQILRRTLANYSHVRSATNGPEAARLVRERAPDLILLGAELPGGHSLRVCQELRAQETLREVPIIFVTARDDVQFEARALELGVVDFLSKPISPPRVRLRVRLHLELKGNKDRLRTLSATDALTRLANRSALDEALAREWLRSDRSDQPLSMLLVDVDLFKEFKDTYGHPIGDECLKVVARAVGQSARRPTDIAARFGGEEFAILLPETAVAGACAVADRLRETVARASVPHRASNVASHVTVSIGVSCRDGARDARHLRPRHVDELPVARSPRDLIELANRALYAAKQRGRNRVEVGSVDQVPQLDQGIWST